jgi:hypothetical protein
MLRWAVVWMPPRRGLIVTFRCLSARPTVPGVHLESLGDGGPGVARQVGRFGFGFVELGLGQDRSSWLLDALSLEAVIDRWRRMPRSRASLRIVAPARQASTICAVVVGERRRFRAVGGVARLSGGRRVPELTGTASPWFESCPLRPTRCGRHNIFPGQERCPVATILAGTFELSVDRTRGPPR